MLPRTRLHASGDLSYRRGASQLIDLVSPRLSSRSFSIHRGFHVSAQMLGLPVLLAIMVYG